LRKRDSETTSYAAEHWSSSSPVIVVSNATDAAEPIVQNGEGLH
jgi:hypothetical protein